MQTIEIQVFSFNELSNEAKERAINDYRSNGRDYSFYYDEIIESIKALSRVLPFKSDGRKWSDIKIDPPSEYTQELQGIRLYKFIVNNYYDDLFKSKYIKSIDRFVNYKPFICRNRLDYKKNPYTMIYSRLNRTNDEVLTGVCYDDDILKPIYDFLKKPDKNTTLDDLANDIGDAISKVFDDVEKWTNSDEFIREEIDANNYQFLENGEIY